MTVVSNGFPLRFRGGRFFLYSVNILINTGGPKPFCVSEGFSVKRMMKKLVCRTIVDYFLGDGIYGYEGENLLIAASNRLRINEEIALEQFEEVPANLKKCKALVAIEPLREIDPNDTSVEQVSSILEMILSSYAINKSDYRKTGQGNYISSDSIDKGTHLLTGGYSVTVKTIADGGFAAFIDPRVYITYPSNRLVAQAVAIFAKNLQNEPTLAELSGMSFSRHELEGMQHYLKGCSVVRLKASSVVHEVVGCQYFDLEKETLTTKDGQILLLRDTPTFKNSKLLNWPLLYVKSRFGSVLLPMDMCLFSDCEPIRSTNPVFSQEGTSLMPGEREEKLKKHMFSMGISENRNPWLEEFGIEVLNRLTAPSDRLPAPSITYAMQPAQMAEDTRKWNIRGYQFDNGGYADVFVIAIVGNQKDVEIVRNFGAWFASECTSLGMKLPAPNKVIIVPSSQYHPDWLTDTFKKTAGEGGDQKYLLYVDSSKIKSHGHLKKLEREFVVVSQHVTLEIAKRAFEKKQRVTLHNIIYKANKKLGGINYTVNPQNTGDLSLGNWEYFKESTLIIASDVCRPNNVYATVGLSSNGSHSSAMYFTGDYAFQNPRQEKIEDKLIFDYTFNAIEKYRKTNKRDPQHIMYLRDGVNDTQHNVVLGEMNAILSAACETGIPRPFMTSVIVVKRHNCRLLTPEGRNPLAGTVVDQVIVDQTQDQFYLQPHTPLLGTAKAPLYKVIANDERRTKRQLEELMNALAFEHQICNSPVSIPAPIYIADELAKRGNNLMKEYEDTMGIEELMGNLSLKGTRLEDLRINA